MLPETLLVIKKLSRRINREAFRLKRAEDLITQTSRELDGMPHAHSHDSTIERLTAAIVDLKSLLGTLLKIRADCRLELTTLLENFIGDFFEQCQTLIYRYAYEFAFVPIARRLGYSKASVYRFHRQGLELLGFDASQIRLLEVDEF